jgi:hypothetical protein
MAQMTKRMLAAGKVVALWSGGECHKVVGVVDEKPVARPFGKRRTMARTTKDI